MESSEIRHRDYLGNEVVVGVNRGKLREEGEGVHLLHNESQNGKHGKAAMLELGLAQNAEIENVREPLESSLSESRDTPVRFYDSELTSGSNPTSPVRVPSRLDGRLRKGTAAEKSPCILRPQAADKQGQSMSYCRQLGQQAI